MSNHGAAQGGRRRRGSRLAVLLALALAGCGGAARTDGPAGATLHPAASPRPSAATASGVPASALPPSAAPASPAPSAPASLGPAPAVTVQRVAAMPSPLAIANAHDGSNRLFVVSQTGQAWVVEGGRRSVSPVLDIAGRITVGPERGLLGLAFHPRFPTDPRLFVDYTDKSGNTVVSSFAVTGSGADSIDAGSERILLRQVQPFPNHNGGGLAFGPDGYLYIALGDGGSRGDPQGNGQRLDTLLAKILRLDVDTTSAGRAYGIPADNPFGSQPNARAEIWLTGLRNPWRFSFDRATGDLWIGDVGQDLWEEVDVAPAGIGGLNFGWNRTEGFHCYAPAQGCPTDGLTTPVAEYGHSARCSITGGFVYRGAEFPSLIGRYVFADYCTGEVFAITAAGHGRREPQLVGRAEIARRRVLLVRPAIDNRTPGEFAESRSKARYPSVLASREGPSSILALARERDADLVGVEEAQFFDDQLVDVVLGLRDSGRHVIVSGLNLDFAGRPFGPMPLLLAHADQITTLSAICVVCGDVATRTQRLVGGRPAAIDDPLVVIGGFDQDAVETYKARCLRHHEVGAPRGTAGIPGPAAGGVSPSPGAFAERRAAD